MKNFLMQAWVAVDLVVGKYLLLQKEILRVSLIKTSLGH
jgi:hypothetical protein